jgi:hypothetical protein
MSNIINRLREPSSWAGLGLLFQGIAQLIASKGADSSGWASVAAGAAAVLMPESRQQGGN